MKKTIIHQIEIGERNLKSLIQIKLPRNTKKVTGIKVTANAYDTNMIILTEEIGWLWLKVAEKRDVFFAEIVKTNLTQNDWYSYDLPFVKDTHGKIGLKTNTTYPISFGQGRAWIDGTKDEFFSIEVLPENLIIEGYYTNTLTSLRGGYTVNIYLAIEV